MGGYQIPGQGPRDDGYDEDGYDESQRAEILEATRDGPGDGTIQTDLAPDLGDDPDEDALLMTDDELGEEDAEAELTTGDAAEDEIQDGLDSGTLGEGDLDDGDEEALAP